MKLGEKLLRKNPRDVLTRRFVIDAYWNKSDWKAVEACSKTGLRYDPRHPDFERYLGAALAQQERFLEASEYLGRALQVAPKSEVALNFAFVRLNLGDVDTAVRALQQAVDVASNSTEKQEATRMAIRIASSMGQYKLAAAFAEQLLELAPDSAEAWEERANALSSARAAFDAAQAARAGLGKFPENTVLLSLLAEKLPEIGENEEGRRVARQVLSMLPPEQLPARRLRFAHTLPVVADSGQEIEEARAHLLDLLDELEREVDRGLRFQAHEAVGQMPFMLTYHGRDNFEIRTKLARLLRKADASLTFTAPHIRQPRKSGRIRVGFLSGLWGNSSITKSTLGFIVNLDRERFEVVTLAFGEASGVMADLLIQHSDEFVVLPQAVLDARRRVAECELDVLLYTEPNAHPVQYLMAFARLARVQCTSIGYPETTGIDSMDFFITTPDWDPPGSDVYYTERLVRLENTATASYYFDPLLPTDDDRAALGLPDGPLYACPQVPFKFHPDIDDLFAAVLRADPEGHLVLLEGNEPSLMRKLQRRLRRTLGENAARVVMLPRLHEAQFNRFLQLVDVLLDPPYYSGYNTTIQSLLMGTPVVTLEGRFNRERHTSTMLKAVGASECIASDIGGYVQRCVELAHDTPLRSHVRQAISANSRHLLGEEGAVLSFEAFLEQAVSHTDQPRLT